MTVGLIWAQAANGVIGRNNELPWDLPEDRAHFRRVTQGATVLMGRRTWQSLPARFRPLPGRRNFVLTTQLGWSDEGAEVVHRLEDLLRPDPGSGVSTAGSGEIWVIGGARVYADALPFADRLEVTEVAGEFEGDVHAPPIGAGWRRVADEPWLTSDTGRQYRMLTYLPS